MSLSEKLMEELVSKTAFTIPLFGGIPVQESVRSGGGNNGAMIQLSQRGIPTVVLGIPVRYIHSHPYKKAGLY